MALESQGFFLSITVVDNGANTSTKEFALDPATITTMALAEAEVAGILAAYNAVTDAEIKSYALGQRFTEGALSLPASGVQVENTAVISSLIDGFVDKYGIVKIPAPVIGIFTGASGKAANIVDAADTDLGTFLSLWTSAGPLVLSDGEKLDTISVAHTSGKRVHRGSRRG